MVKALIFLAKVDQSIGLGANADAAKSIIEQSNAVGREVQLATDTTWEQILSGPLFLACCNLGAIIFGLSILVAGVLWVASTVDPQRELPTITLEVLFISILIAILLGTPANRGKLLGEVTLQVHKVKDGAANLVVSSLSAEVGKDVIGQAQAKSAIESSFPVELETCLAIDDVKKRDFCLLRADDQIKSGLIRYQNTGWAQTLYERYHNVIQQSLTRESKDKFDPLATAGKVVGGALGAITGGASVLFMRGFLISIGTAYLWLLGLADILTGLVLVFFIAAALFSKTYNPAVVGIMAFLGVGFANLFYKLTLGIASLAVLNSPPTDPLIFPLIITLGGIPLSIWLVRAGGLSIVGGVGSFVRSRR